MHGCPAAGRVPACASAAPASSSCCSALPLPRVNRSRRAAPAAASNDRGSAPTAKLLEDAGTRSFLSWAKDAKISFSSLAPATFDGLRGMTATSGIKPDALLVSVPRRSAIVLTPRQKCPFPDWIQREYWEAAPWFVKIALMLLDQQRQGSSARLAGYLQQLPKSVDVPVLWDEQSLQSLQYHHLINLVGQGSREPVAGEVGQSKTGADRLLWGGVRGVVVSRGRGRHG